MPTQWSDETFLDDLRHRSDERADVTIETLVASHGIEYVNRIFPMLSSNASRLPPDAPEPLHRFIEETRVLPADLDFDRLERGGEAFMAWVLEMGTMMLIRSLPSGYAAPRLAQVLCISNDLGNATFNRVLSVMQLLVNVGAKGGFHPDGHALITAQKMRLLHAGARHVARRHLKGFEENHGGEPISIEDMLATGMGFSYLVIEPVRRLNLGMSEQAAEDIYYLWRVYSAMMGLHPPAAEGQPPTLDWVPKNLSEAAEFYDTYARRHFVSADENPEGCYLAAADLHMLRQLIPWPLRLMGLGKAPRLLMWDALGTEGMRRVGLTSPGRETLLRWLSHVALRLYPRSRGRSLPARFMGVVLQDFIVWRHGHPVEFIVPQSRSDLQRLAYKRSSPCLRAELMDSRA